MLTEHNLADFKSALTTALRTTDKADSKLSARFVELRPGLIESLRAPVNHLITGRRGVGKSTNLAALEHQARDSGDWVIFVDVAFVPVGAPRLLDAAALEQPDLGDRVARIVRERGLVSQAAGLDVAVRADGITVFGKTPEAFAGTTVVLTSDGAVFVQADTRAEGMMGGSAIAHDKVVSLVEAGSLAAQDLWALADPGGRVRQVAATLGVADASMKVYAVSPIGNTMSMPMSMPAAIVAPDPPLTVRRSDVGTDATNRRLVAELKRTFVDLGAIHDR